MTTYVFSLPTVDADGRPCWIGVVTADPDGLTVLHETRPVYLSGEDAELIAAREWADRVREILEAA